MSKDVQSGETFVDDSGSERRGEIRHDAALLGKVTARLIGGSEVSLVNFSNRGLLFESDSRLLIGARASVRLTTTDANLVVTGRVVRSRVKGVVNGALRYDAALALDAELSLAPPEMPASAAGEMHAHAAPAPDVAAAEAAEPLVAAGDTIDTAVSHADPAPAAEADLGFAAATDDPADAPDWPDPAADADDDAVVQLYATVPHDLAELRRLANDNQW